MKHLLTVMLLLSAALYAASDCGETNRHVFQVSKALGQDLFTGKLVRYEDTHGGFHGDGLTEAEIELDGLAENLEGALGWKPLPMSDLVAQATGLFRGKVAAVSQGYYYFYDRHSESTDPYDDTQLCSRASWNFTAAVYDSQQGRLYYYKLDT